MLKYFFIASSMIVFCRAGQNYVDGILMPGSELPLTIPVASAVLQFNVVDSFPAAATGYSVGLGCDGKYLWNNEAFIRWFARMDTATGVILNTFNTTIGNRDMTFDGQYLWASDWQTSSISKFDTANCSVISTYYPPFSAGRPHGMAWDGANLWVGEESGRIYKMTTTGDTVRSIPPPIYYSYDPRGLAFDGSHLWVGYQSSGLIYKVDTTNGNVIASYQAPGVVPTQRFQQGLDCDGYFLWSTVGGAVQKIYQIDIGLLGAKEQINKRLASKIEFNISPNPFAAKTKISFVLNKTTDVSLSVIDASGRIVTSLINQKKLLPGEHNFTWQASEMRAGIYFAVITTHNYTKAVKLIKL